MVIVIDFGADVQSYVVHSEARSFPRPAVCPHCQVSGTLIGHGFSARQPTDGEHDYRIQIKGWCCSACHRTTSLLPSFLLRFRHYLLRVIQSVVVARFEQHASWTQLSAQVTASGRPAVCTCVRWCRSFAPQASRAARHH